MKLLISVQKSIKPIASLIGILKVLNVGVVSSGVCEDLVSLELSSEDEEDKDFETDEDETEEYDVELSESIDNTFESEDSMSSRSTEEYSAEKDTDSFSLSCFFFRFRLSF